jgi:transposase
VRLPIIGRELKKLGRNVRLMPAKDVKAYVKRGKNDAVDSAACCEAVERPTVRTVPVKTPEQQAQLMQRRVRDLLIRRVGSFASERRGAVFLFTFPRTLCWDSGAVMQPFV